jgi:RNA polymerase sigma-54 factor
LCGMSIRVGVSPALKPKTTPKMVILSRLLELPSAEMEQAIRQELAENPALQVTESGYCESCGATYSGSFCPHCQGATATQARSDSVDESYPTGSSGWTDDEWDPFSMVAAPWSIRDHLLWQVSPLISDVELEIASLLLENLDHRGLLDCDLEGFARTVDASVEQVEHVLFVMQRQEPVGIGARTVEQSLLIQLESLEGGGEVAHLCERLILEHWESLCKDRLDKIAKSLEVGIEDVRRARDFIRSHLHPYPISACAQPPAYAERPVDAQYLRPDVVITVSGPAGEEEFEIRFPEQGRFRLNLDRTYRELCEVFDAGDGQGDEREQEHVRQYVARGQLFISGWEERWRTLRRVVEGLVESQREFLLHDERSLRPLTRARLADTLSLHESTVSRATASKYALIPGGRIVALADFFDGSLKAKHLIKEWVSQESSPLTDGELMEMLAGAGITVARRTVQTYRQALGILPSGLR